MPASALHTFHIPVMGIAFTIDSPIKVARFGINSVVSIIEDNLIEVMRKHYYQKINEPYVPITTREENYRARRVTDYLNLVNRIVNEQFEKLKNSAFETGSDLVKYFEMLPDGSRLKEKYQQLFHLNSPREREVLQEQLRNEIRPGDIEVNIMTKVDKVNLKKDGTPIEDGSDALTALKGYAESDIGQSSIIFSAGMNPRLFNYMEKFDAFDAIGWGEFKKKVVIKVSDYRSALIQGKYLAKKGIWVSEFRIESGLNCGGHAFATQGILLGPILEEFRVNREELAESLFQLYAPAVKRKGQEFEKPHPIKITVQGGIGTFSEDEFLRKHYQLDGTGWGTPFLLCPEATTVDENTLDLLSKAREEDVVLSKSSPLGVRFNYLKGNSAEIERRERIAKGTPGSPCTEKFLVSNTEFTKEPICTASKKYQKLKLAQLRASELDPEELKIQEEEVLSKECLCIGLSNAAAKVYEQPFVKKQEAVTICPGPNIVNFSKIASLQEMVDHIYGRGDLLNNPERPHMFVRELQLYVDYLKEQLASEKSLEGRAMNSLKEFGLNLFQGIDYYRDLLENFQLDVAVKIEEGLQLAEKEIHLQLQRLQMPEQV